MFHEVGSMSQSEGKEGVTQAMGNVIKARVYIVLGSRTGCRIWNVIQAG